MCDAENIRAVEQLDIDWMGFIFYRRSPRYAGDADTEIIRRCIRKKVGVFVNAPVEEILTKAAHCKLDYVQLHGDESPAICRDLTVHGLPVIKAFPIASTDDLKRTEDYESAASFFLFDTKCEGYGGSGQRFDWSVLANYQGNTPFLLSGGLTPDAADEVRRFRHPMLAGIDLNSGFETAPAMKNTTTLAPFIKHIRQTKNSGNNTIGSFTFARVCQCY
jgi:phosphoribosylanthranilate isomerase